MKRILVLTNIYPAPDLEKENTPVVHYFTREWVKMGYDVRVIHYPTNFPKLMMWAASLFKKQISSKLGATIRTFQATEKEYEIDSVIVSRIPMLKTKLHGVYSKKMLNKAFEKTVKCLEQQFFVPDIITSHWVNPQLEMMVRLKELYNCRACYVAHTPVVEFDNIYTLEQSKALIRKIDLIGFRSAHIRDVFCKRFNYTGPSFQCYSGIPGKYIPSSSINRQFDTVSNFVFVGTLIKRKYPAEIVPALATAFGTDKFSISYIGKGAEVSKITKFAKKFNVVPQVHLLGYIERDEVVRQLQINDVFVMISKNEAFGLVYLEAMAQGLIVIASREEGFDGIIEHGKNGFLCEAGNIAQLSVLVKEIRAMKPEQLQEISRNAVETTRRLTDKNAAKMYIKELEGICN